MKWLSRVIKLRKQNDYVKIMLLVFMLGVVMFGGAVQNGVNVYSELSKPAEYVLSANPNKMTMDDLNELTRTKEIDATTIQKSVDLTINIAGEEEPLECYQVSESYLKSVYHVNEVGAMKTFYLTPKAYERIKRNLKVGKSDKDEIQSEYQLGENEKGTAKFVLLHSELFSDQELAFCAGNSVDFSQDCNEIRAHIIKRDLTGALETHIENLGYGIENMELVQETEYNISETFLKMKYDFVIAVLCIGFVIVLGRLIKTTNPM